MVPQPKLIILILKEDKADQQNGITTEARVVTDFYITKVVD